MKLRDANLQVSDKNFTHPHFHTAFHFQRIHHDYFFQRAFAAFESVRAQFLLGNISGLLVIYLFNYNSSKSTFYMLNMQLDVLLNTAFVK